MGVEDTFHPTPVGVWFGRPGERTPTPTSAARARPGRLHPLRQLHGRLPHEAKNSLDHNYLYLAEKHGARVCRSVRSST
jgi:cholesterol oxidase